MQKNPLTLLAISFVSATLFFSTVSFADAEKAADTSATIAPQTAAADTANVRTNPQSPESLAKPQDFLSRAIKWANSNEGFITLFTALVAAGWGLFLFLRSRKRTPKPQITPDTRNAKQRYLDYIITTHQNLPVAGFETNLRVPIPLENVYVTLQARMTEIDSARDGRRELLTELREFQPDRNVTVQEALQFALNKNYDGVVILGQPGSGKTTLAKYFPLCFATGKAEKNLQLSQKLLPILLFLREVDPEKSCLENILAALQKHQLGLDESFFLPYLQKGEAILLLDGLDEVPTEEKRQQVSRWIHQ